MSYKAIMEDIKITDLEMSQRNMHNLIHAGFNNAYDLANTWEDKLTKIKGVGKKSLAELKKIKSDFNTMKLIESKRGIYFNEKLGILIDFNNNIVYFANEKNNYNAYLYLTIDFKDYKFNIINMIDLIRIYNNLKKKREKKKENKRLLSDKVFYMLDDKSINEIESIFKNDKNYKIAFEITFKSNSDFVLSDNSKWQKVFKKYFDTLEIVYEFFDETIITNDYNDSIAFCFDSSINPLDNELTYIYLLKRRFKND